MWSVKAGGLLTLLNYTEKCTFGGLKWWSLKISGLSMQVVLRIGLTVNSSNKYNIEINQGL